MSPTLPITEFLNASRHMPVIDVRSPAEFAKGHIPGAHNIPLFSNEERAVIGTRYKRTGKDAAVLAGLEVVGPKLAAFVRDAQSVAIEGKVLVHCWRGGMRSSSFAWLLNTAGLQATTLRNGYKAFRRFVLHSFEAPYTLVVLGGETGSGKTDILRHLKAQGEQVIDLEGLAHHKGSSFGALGQAPQPGVETFENFFSRELLLLDPSRRIWVEDESKSIGRVFIPDGFWKQMVEAPVIRVAVPKDARVARLVEEYGKFSVPELEAAVERIQKRLGGLVYKQCIEALHSGDLAFVADLTLGYYDKAYNFNKERPVAGIIQMEGDDPAAAATQVIAWVNEHRLPVPAEPAKH